MSVFVRGGEERWRCNAGGCGAGGSVAALLAALRFHEVPARGDPRWVEVFRELEGTVEMRPRPVVRRPAPRPVDDAPTWPPAAEVAALWDAARPLQELDDDDVVAAYLRSRGLDPRRIGVLDLSRALGPGTRLPAWAPRGASTHRLLTPMVDPAGALRSLRFRAVGAAPGGRKTLNPRGYGYAGLVLADPMARALLAGRPDDEGVRWDGRVVVVEGEPDFWTWATHPGRFGVATTYAVVGLASGSWSAPLAARIPDGARVIVRTHHDPPGERYAEAVRRTLAGRCPVLRGGAFAQAS